MNEEQPTFKVTDRRLFNADGSPRELTAEEKSDAKAAEKPDEKPAEEIKPAAVAEPLAAASAPKTPAATAEAKVHTAPPAPVETAATDEPAHQSQADEEDFVDEIPDADDPASFVNFAMSIATNAAS